MGVTGKVIVSPGSQVAIHLLSPAATHIKGGIIGQRTINKAIKIVRKQLSIPGNGIIGKVGGQADPGVTAVILR